MIESRTGEFLASRSSADQESQTSLPHINDDELLLDAGHGEDLVVLRKEVDALHADMKQQQDPAATDISVLKSELATVEHMVRQVHQIFWQL